MHKIGRLQIYLILTLALFVHLTLLDHIRIFGVKPDLMIIAVIFFGLFLGTAKGFESGLAAGLLKDLFAADFFGINACVLALIGFLAGVMGARFSGESKRTQSLIVILLMALSMTLHYIIASTFSKWTDLGFGEYLAGSVLPAAIYTTIISLPVLYYLSNRYELRPSEDY